MEPQPDRLEFDAENARLTGFYYAPEGRPRANLVLHGATGVPQRYSRHFASWAASQGIGVLTYDYRDFGVSCQGHPQNSKAVFTDWAFLDQQAAQSELARVCPDGPLWVLGHSLGGLTVGFHDYDPRISRVLTFGSGMGHHSDHPRSYRPTAIAFWFIVGPVAIALSGYLPGKRLLLGADLPAGVYWQWRRWCTHKSFFNGDIGKALPQPSYAKTVENVKICVAKDDVVVPPTAVRRYASFLAQGGVSYVELDPSDYGLSALGHIESLGKGNESMWSDFLDLNRG